MKNYFCLFVGSLLVLPTSWSSSCYGRTTTYTFTAPPDEVLVSINGVGSDEQWPTQILDAQTIIETLSGIAFNNQLNNTLFIDNNALIVQNASILDGNYAWADARGNGPNDPAFFEIDFTNASGGVPQRIEFDFVVAISLPNLIAQVSDTDGDSLDFIIPATGFSFDGGSDNGSQAHVVLTPTGVLDNLAQVRFSLGDGDGVSTLQVGFDNLVIDNGESADFGGDGYVDAADLATWAGAFGGSSGGDADGDGDSDGHDFLIWQQEYTGPPPITVSQTTVPEPTALALGVAACIVLLPFRRDARSR